MQNLHPDDLQEADSVLDTVLNHTDAISAAEDVLRCATLQQGSDAWFMIMCIEALSFIDYGIAYRIFEYKMLLYRHQMKAIANEHQENADLRSNHEYLSHKLKPVNVVVLYTGTEEWDAPVKFSDLLGRPEEANGSPMDLDVTVVKARDASLTFFNKNNKDMQAKLAEAVIVKQLGTEYSVPQDEAEALIMERREAMESTDSK